MKVLVADKFERSGVEGLRQAGCEVVYEPELKDDALAQAIASTGADVLVVRGTKVTTPMLDAGRLSLIVRAGAGYNTIDVAGASKRGIYVSNCPGKNAIAVAELAFALILALDRRVPDNVVELRAGKWNKKEYSKAQGLFGRTLGLIGAGSIAREMIQRAAGFGMNVALWSRRFDGQDRPLSDQEARELGVESARRTIRIALAPTPAEVAARAEIVSVHVALAPDTRGLVNAALLERLKPGTIFINTARGEVVDYTALADVVRRNSIRVGLDVYANEPAAATADFRDELAALPGVYGTHHIGASTDQAQEAVAAETVRIVAAY
jgi:D-3-phosphoglycerate dehydrogenase